MNKVRALSVLSLIVCIGIFSLGLEHCQFDSTEAILASWQWALLALAGGYGIISAIAVTLLSIFAVQPSLDGSFTIKRDSLYGKVFLSFVDMKYKNSMSLCTAFWRTNLLLFIISVLVGMATVLVTMLIQAKLINIIIGVAIAIGIIVALILFGFAIEFVGDNYQEFERKSPRVANIVSTIPSCLILTMYIGVICGWIYVIGLATIWAVLVAWVPWLAMWAVILGVIISLLYGLYWIVSKQFGKEFASFYHQNLCPRIKIK